MASGSGEMRPGIRVVRGPDWQWSKQDGGEGHVGTVQKFENQKEVVILWDNGTMANYRCCDPYDIRILDGAPAGIFHGNVVCHECGCSPIFGTRWVCTTCSGVSLCSKCYHDDKHNDRHGFSRMPIPEGPQIPVSQPRVRGKKVLSKGLYSGARVVRGMHWCWENQDGGDGRKGRVIEVQDWNASQPGSGVMVEWDKGYKNMYRLGYQGKVDVRVVREGREGRGFAYYRDHLPLLGETKVERHGSFGVGDFVKCCKTLDAARRLQIGHGGWSDKMMEIMMNVGRVTSIDMDGDMVVTYPSTYKWTINPAILEKVIVETPILDSHHSVSPYQVGDFIKVSSDIRLVKRLQIGHGGWVDSMQPFLGNVAQVVGKCPDGDLKLKFHGSDRTWTFNPECATRVDADGAPLTPSTTEHVSEMLRAAFESHVPTSMVERLIGSGSSGDVTSIMEILESKNCNVNEKLNGQTALHLACQNGHLAAIKCLLSHGARVDIEDSKGDFPIHYAALGDEPEVVELLAKEDIDLNVRNNKKQTPLHLATIKGHISVIRAILKHHGHPSLQDAQGDTPLHDALEKKREDIVEILVEHKADISLVNKLGFSSVHLAARKGLAGAMKVILSKLPPTLSLDEAKTDGFTALHLAALNNHRAVAELLIAAGASKDLQNEEKKTPLHLAVERERVELVRLLVDNEASANIPDKLGNTALHEAIQGHTMVQLRKLAGSGQDLSSAITRVSTPTEKSSASISSLLVSRGADPFIKNTNGMTPLDLCSDPNLHRILLKLHEENKITSARDSEREATPPGVSGDRDEVPPENSECMVCSDTTRNAVFLPCGHMAMCWSCAEKVKKCLVCKASIERKEKVEECLVCSEKQSDLIFKPCLHVVVCRECGEKIKKCLSCREVVQEKMRVVKSFILGASNGSVGSLSDGQTKNLLREIESLKDQLLCSICCERRKNCVLQCGHTYCQMCADRLSSCPICKKNIEKRQIMYES